MTGNLQYISLRIQQSSDLEDGSELEHLKKLALI